MAKIRQDAPDLITKYIENPETKPVLRDVMNRLRELVHETVPRIQEDWKWGPNFNLNGMVCGFGGFQNHVSFVFFKGSLMQDHHGLFSKGLDNDHSRMIQFRAVSDIDEAKLTDYLQEAAQLNLDNVEVPKKEKTIETPADMAEALEANGQADYFRKLTYYHRKEYIEWITEAKRNETRKTRIAKMMTMLAEKQGLNDKYRPKSKV